ncbi:MAG: heavy-metal-associated domain-containing protein [Gammaproteobacteria bacterium]|nr:heavy-metal-associated domain-containing protein [Gammaproteobacteria bacterium]
MSTNYIHHVPGRLRVRDARLKRNADGIAAVQSLVSAIDGVLDVSVSTVTGSVVITYDRDLTCPHALLDELKQRGCCNHTSALPTAAAPKQAVSNALSNAGNAMGKAVFGVMVEKLVERSAMALIGALL